MRPRRRSSTEADGPTPQPRRRSRSQHLGVCSGAFSDGAGVAWIREARPDRPQKAAPYVQRAPCQFLGVWDERIGFRCLVGNPLHRSFKWHLGPPSPCCYKATVQLEGFQLVSGGLRAR
jgi:hypothetical protein